MDSENSGRPATFLALGVLAFTATCFVVSMYCFVDWANWRMNGRTTAPNSDQPEQFSPLASKGLDQSQIQSIPVCFYRAADEAIQGTECTICLGKFEEEEKLRLLPKCGHAFHVPCIDKWLQLNSNCPLCRCTQILPSLENGDVVVVVAQVSAAPEIRLQEFCPELTDRNQDASFCPQLADMNQEEVPERVFAQEGSLHRRSSQDHLTLKHKLFRYKSMPCPRAASESNGHAFLAADLV